MGSANSPIRFPHVWSFRGGDDTSLWGLVRAIACAGVDWVPCRLLRLSLGLLPALLAAPAMVLAVEPVSSGGTPEAFAQLTTRNIVPMPGSPPAVTASAVMSVDSSPSCVTKKPTFDNLTWAPAFVAGSVPVDTNSFPVQFTYFDSTIYEVSPGYLFDYLEVIVLDVSCSVTLAGGSASSFNFQIPIYLCNIPDVYPTQPAMGLSTSGCAVTEIPSGCTAPSAGIVAPNSYAHNSSTENLKVYQPPSPTTPPEDTPAVAVDIQLFYNGFTVPNLKGLSPFLVRATCSALSAFTNQ